MHFAADMQYANEFVHNLQKMILEEEKPDLVAITVCKAFDITFL
jgi:hypothetical protein